MTNESDVTQRKDIAKELIADGLLCLESRREKRLQKLVSFEWKDLVDNSVAHEYYGVIKVADYLAAQDSAKKRHLNIWRYGDITDDDANEFGVGARRN